MDDPYAAERAASAKEQKRRWDEIARELGIDPRTTNAELLNAIRQAFIKR